MNDYWATDDPDQDSYRYRKLSEGSVLEVESNQVKNDIGQPALTPAYGLLLMLYGIDQYVSSEEIKAPTRTEALIQLRVLFLDPQQLGYQESFRRIDFSVSINPETFQIERYSWRAQWTGHESCDYEAIGVLDAYGIDLNPPTAVQDSTPG